MYLILFLLAITVPAFAAPAWPLKVSANGRRLVDQKNQPFLIHGDTAWSLLVQLSKQDAERYLEDRRRRGFNAVLVNLIEYKYADRAPFNREMNAPFRTAGDFSTPNESYFAHADWVIAKAAEKGIAVFLFPAYFGKPRSGSGWWAELNANGAEKCRNYGRYLGSRYRSFANIIWVHGGDYTPPEDAAGMAFALEILHGIKERDSSKLHSFHGVRSTTALGHPTFAPHLDLDSVYPGDELGGGGTSVPTSPAEPYTLSLQAYNRQGFRPHYLIEARYESLLGKPANAGPHASDRPRFRRQVFWSILGGSTGHFFGNFPVWPFSAGWDGVAGIGSPANQDMERLWSLFRSRPWHKLVPDPHPAAVPTDSAVTARAHDGSLILSYVPDSKQSNRTVSVDMTRLSGKATAKWFNPADGRFRMIGDRANSGSQRFEVPGDNGTGATDWVLVLELQNRPNRERK